MINVITTALTGIRASCDLIKTAVAARDDLLVEKAILEMTDRFITAQGVLLEFQEKHFSMSNEIRDLKEQIRQLEIQNADFENYELHKTVRGGIVHRSKLPINSSGEFVHLCSNCVANGVKTFLQPEQGGFWLTCHLHGRVASDIPDKSPEKMRKMIASMSS